MVIDSTSKERRTPFSLEPTTSSVMSTRRENWIRSIFPSLSNRCSEPAFPLPTNLRFDSSRDF